MSDSSNKYQGRDRRSSFAVSAMLFLIWIGLLTLPTVIAGGHLDESWRKSFAYFLDTGMQAGTDYVFTYGPLGFFIAPVYHRDLFWAGFVWELLIKSLLIYYLFWIFRGHLHLATKISCLVPMALFLPMLPRDVTYLLFITVIGLRLTDENLSWPIRITSLVLLSLLSLGKFVLFLFASVIVFYYEIQHRKQNPRSYFSAVAFFLISFSAAWIAIGQSISGLPTYLFSSLQISFGYNEAMATYGNSFETTLSICVLLLILAALIQIMNTERKPVRYLMLATGTLLAWKLGFIRQDNHPAIFFGYVFVLAFVLIGLGSLTRQSRLMFFAIMFFSVFGSILGIFQSMWVSVAFQKAPARSLIIGYWSRFKENTGAIVSPRLTKSKLEREETAKEQEWSFPLISSVVKNSSIDVMSHQQGILLLNRMNWQPRPVFQSYGAYTAYLARRNADFFRSSRAPDFVLYKVQPIDKKFPSAEDGLALFEILQKYEPQATERSFLLLRKKMGTVESINREVIQKAIVRFDSQIPVDRSIRYQELQFNFNETVFGRIRKFVYKPSPIFIAVTMNSGITLRFRLVPALARDGFLLSPLVLRTSDIAQIYRAKGGASIKSFTLQTTSPGLWFKNEVNTEIRKLSWHRKHEISDTKLLTLIDSINSGASYVIECATSVDPIVVPLDFSEATISVGKYQVIFGEGFLEAQPLVLPAGKHRIVFEGHGTKAGNEFPRVEFYLNGETIGALTIAHSDQYALVFELKKKQEVKFGVSLINDAVIGDQDRNVFIQRAYVDFGLETIQTDGIR